MKVLAIGECMIELRHRAERELDLSFAGDTYNTSVYLSRLQELASMEVAYMTAVGIDL